MRQKQVDPQIQFTGQQFLEVPAIQLFRYSEASFREIAVDNDFSSIAEQLGNQKDENFWVNVHGLHDTETIRQIAHYFEIDNLVIQDIVDTNQRPKVEVYPDYLFFSVKSILPTERLNIDSEQISFILKENVLLSFQEKKGDHFEHIRQRIREGKGIVRKKEADFLLYLLLYAITGNCFSTLSGIESILNEIPSKIMKEPRPGFIAQLEDIKRNLIFLRKSIVPLKEAVIFTEKEQTKLINPGTSPYFADLKDQLLQITDEADLNLTRAEGSTNLFFSYQGQRMNEVMKVLTIVATLFIPLTFVAGIYGMNFENMPELSWRWGYPAVWGLILIVASGMIIYFRKKKWL
ncbi:MAG: magnesium/cobalt transporter CorA [Marinilabilia sp.]